MYQTPNDCSDFWTNPFFLFQALQVRKNTFVVMCKCMFCVWIWLLVGMHVMDFFQPTTHIYSVLCWVWTEGRRSLSTLGWFVYWGNYNQSTHHCQRCRQASYSWQGGQRCRFCVEQPWTDTLIFHNKIKISRAWTNDNSSTVNYFGNFFSDNL